MGNSCIATVPIFRALPPESMAELATAMRHRHFRKGELVAAAGSPVTHLLVVARGRLQLIHSTSAGKEQVVRTLEPGEFVGELALFTPQRQQGDLVAQEDSEACLLPRAAVQAMLRQHPDVASGLVEALACRLADAERLLADISLRDVGQRLAAELLRRMPAGAADGGEVRVKVPVPWAEMALRLATTPESLSRRLKVLEQEGLIRQAGRQTLVLRDRRRLAAMAAG